MYHFFKRFSDILLSALGMVALCPVFFVLSVAVKLSSPGPVLFGQKRVGKDKAHFTMLKFRTMRTDAPADTPTHLLKDPYAYITGVGRFLRKTSLDELPQLWHIFSGDMSIVGPRPALWNQEDLIAERDRYGANDIRPGLTGLAQIQGRDELPIAQKAAYDGEYRRRMSPGLDLQIMCRTFTAVLGGKGISEGGPKN